MTQTTSTAIRFFVAAPQGNRDAIAGLGYTAEQAIADAYAQVGTKPAVVSQDAEGNWTVNDGVNEAREFSSKSDADEHAASIGMVALEATERFYVHVRMHGLPSAWGTKDSLLDLDLGEDEDEIDEALDEVKAGFEGLGGEAKDEWTAETALADANDYVSAYLLEDDATGKWGELAADKTPFRTALDLRVRDIILQDIIENH